MGASTALRAQNGSSSPVHTGPIPNKRFYSLMFRHILYLQDSEPQAEAAGTLSY